MKKHNTTLLIISLTICFYLFTNNHPAKSETGQVNKQPISLNINVPLEISKHGMTMDDLDKQVAHIKQMSDDIAKQGGKINVSWKFKIHWEKPNPYMINQGTLANQNSN